MQLVIQSAVLEARHFLFGCFHPTDSTVRVCDTHSSWPTEATAIRQYFKGLLLARHAVSLASQNAKIARMNRQSLRLRPKTIDKRPTTTVDLVAFRGKSRKRMSPPGREPTVLMLITSIVLLHTQK